MFFYTHHLPNLPASPPKVARPIRVAVRVTPCRGMATLRRSPPAHGGSATSSSRRNAGSVTSMPLMIKALTSMPLMIKALTSMPLMKRDFDAFDDQGCRRQDGIKCVKHEIHVHELHPSEDLCHQTLAFKPSQLPAHCGSARRPTMQRHQDAFPAEIEKDRA